MEKQSQPGRAAATVSRLQGLIDLLVADLVPTSPTFVEGRVAWGIGPGIAVAAALVLALWGPRPDFAAALMFASFWVKGIVTLALGICGVRMLLNLGRPAVRAGMAARAAFWVVLALGMAAAVQWGVAAPGQRMPLLLGNTAAACPWLIMLLSVPILAGALWALRGLAPTRPRLAGASAGFTAGAFAAFVYAISCDEQAMPFVFVWYGGAIAAVTAAGSLLGPKLLRW